MLLLERENQGGAFSLDLLLYYFACIAVDNEERDAALIQVMFNCLLKEAANSANGKFKSPFACYILIMKEHYKKEKITDEKIADLYGIDPRSFRFYKSGERALPLKKIALIIEQGHTLLPYFITLFWAKLIASYSNGVDSRRAIMNKINLYPKLFDIAKAEFCDFERKNRA